jgi:predicted amidophosphoribosyltransferase
MVRAAPVPIPDGLDRCVALLGYEGVGRELVARIKYRNHRAVLRWLAAGMATLVRQGEVDLVTWAPTTVERRRDRGFDHAELLARHIAADLGLPVRTTLRRRPGPAQTGRRLDERRHGPSFVGLPESIGGRRVLLVDDVVTTGATFAAAGKALRHAGAPRVVGLAAAHPRRGRDRSGAAA